jgi:hypothetical protein
MSEPRCGVAELDEPELLGLLSSWLQAASPVQSKSSARLYLKVVDIFVLHLADLSDADAGLGCPRMLSVARVRLCQTTYYTDRVGGPAHMPAKLTMAGGMASGQ